MIALRQRVSEASVTVNNQIIGEINQGLLVLTRPLSVPLYSSLFLGKRSGFLVGEM